MNHIQQIVENVGIYHENVLLFSVSVPPPFPQRQPTPAQGVSRTDGCCGKVQQMPSVQKTGTYHLLSLKCKTTVFFKQLKPYIPHTLASCLVRKSMKPKPLCFPVPAAFFGRRTVLSSPNVLRRQTEEIWALLKHLTPHIRHMGWIKDCLSVTATRRVLEFPWRTLGMGHCAQGSWILSASSPFVSSCATRR